MKNWKISFFIFSLVLMTVTAVGFAYADDDDEEDDEESKPKIEYVTETVILKPAQVVTETVMKDFSVDDSDRDGLDNENDPHPNIPEIFIVKDENKDGVDDQYQF